MAKKVCAYLCTECGYKTSKWLGHCPSCGQWNCFIEEVSVQSEAESAKIVQVFGIAAVSDTDAARMTTGIAEFDRCSGGIVTGQAILISGEPGIGKSTLLLQAAAALSQTRKALYFSGEESVSQVTLRANRLKIHNPNLLLCSENQLENILQTVREHKPDAVFIDSIQTVFSASYDSLPGSIVQVRECAFELVRAAKTMGIPMFLIAHITKSGSIAGPKIVEHIVDTVLFLETDARGYYRILRSLKNRFYSTDEIGFFQMEEGGMIGVEELSGLFTAIHESPTSGVAIYAGMEGNRSFPIEIQALCVPSQFNYPKRAADGVDINRLTMLCAVMEKQLKLTMTPFDIYVNVTGGFRMEEPASDLAVICAIYSSVKDKPMDLNTAFVGEVGLTGEVRPVRGMERRIAEMKRLGFKKIFAPYRRDKVQTPDGITVYPVRSISEASELI